MRTERARRQRQLDDLTAARLKRDQREKARIEENAKTAAVVAAVTAKLTRRTKPEPDPHSYFDAQFSAVHKRYFAQLNASFNAANAKMAGIKVFKPFTVLDDLGL
jgi:hypothetical protein